jgi:5-methylcytosine-specific restriction endonuclease McrA
MCPVTAGDPREDWSNTMAFSEATKEQALASAGNRCQCTRVSHIHSGRCNVTLTKSTAEGHHMTAVASGGSDALSNCEVLCHTCHVLIPKPH